MNFLEELKWRGMLQDIMPGTEEQLAKEMTTGYVGFDPTADSLHVGNLIPIILLMRLQRHGHKPIALVGGATGMVGDPSGKSAERNLLDEETLNHNIKGVKAQLERFLDFSDDKANKAELVNNFDWFKNFSFLDFIRDVGKHITVNYMMAKDSVKKRLESGMSFTEFSYQLVQGYDFYYLYENHGVKLQMGGSDQWGNIVTGTELIRRKTGGEGFAFTCPLLTKSDGSKFGKSESGNIWLSKEKTSPYKFYQYWLNASDEDAVKWIKIFTFLTPDEIEALIASHTGQEHLRGLQKRLAEELTLMVHGADDLLFAQKASEILFSADTQDVLKSMDSAQLEDVFEGVPKGEMSSAELIAGVGILDFLTVTGVLPSKGEAKRALAAGSIMLNKIKITDAETTINNDFVIGGQYIVVQNGKKKYFLIKAV